MVEEAVVALDLILHSINKIVGLTLEHMIIMIIRTQEVIRIAIKIMDTVGISEDTLNHNWVILTKGIITILETNLMMILVPKETMVAITVNQRKVELSLNNSDHNLLLKRLNI